MLAGISIWQLLIILAIVVMLFGTKKLRSLGGDLGGAIKGFRQAMSSEDKNDNKEDAVIDNNSDNSEAKHKA